MAKILVVDDDRSVSRSVKFLLEGLGHVVVTASSAEEGLEKIPRENPDLVLTDLNMSGMDGIGFAAAIKANSPNLPVVLMTGSTTDSRLKDALYVDKILYKPCSPDDFQRLLDDLRKLGEFL